MNAMTETRTWTLTIPAPAKMYSANTSDHWRQTGEAKKLWRDTSFTFATQARLPKGLARVRIDVSLHFTVNRGRDDSNYHPYVGKPIVDGLSKTRQVKYRGRVRVEPGYELIPDDTSEFLETGGPVIVVGEKVDKKAYPLGLAVVTITEVAP